MAPSTFVRDYQPPATRSQARTAFGAGGRADRDANWRRPSHNQPGDSDTEFLVDTPISGVPSSGLDGPWIRPEDIAASIMGTGDDQGLKTEDRSVNNLVRVGHCCAWQVRFLKSFWCYECPLSYILVYQMCYNKCLEVTPVIMALHHSTPVDMPISVKYSK